MIYIFFRFGRVMSPQKRSDFASIKTCLICAKIFLLSSKCVLSQFFLLAEVYLLTDERLNRCYFYFLFDLFFFCYQFPIVNLTGKKQKRGINTDVQLMRTYEKINIYLSFIKFVYVPCSENKRSIIFCDQFWGELIKWDNFPCSNFYHDLTERCVTQHRERRKYKLSIFKLKANKYFTFAVVHVMCQSRGRGRGLHVIKGKGMLVAKN